MGRGEAARGRERGLAPCRGGRSGLAGRASVRRSLLHPDFPAGRPFFVPAQSLPQDLATLLPAAQLAELKERAEDSGLSARMRWGTTASRCSVPGSRSRPRGRSTGLGVEIEQPGGAGGRRGGAVREGRSGRGFRPPRPAGARRSPGRRACGFTWASACSGWPGSKAAKRQLRLGRAAEPGCDRRRGGADAWRSWARPGRLTQKIGLTAYGVRGELLARFHNFARKVLRFLQIATTVSAIGGGAEVSAGGSTNTIGGPTFDVMASSEAKALLDRRQAGRQADRGRHRDRVGRARSRRGTDGRVLRALDELRSRSWSATSPKPR